MLSTIVRALQNLIIIATGRKSTYITHFYADIQVQLADTLDKLEINIRFQTVTIVPF
jgi:hypothetical protein